LNLSRDYLGKIYNQEFNFEKYGNGIQVLLEGFIDELGKQKWVI